MKLKKISTIFFLPLLLTSFLSSQTLAELAKKERERREKLKDKKTIVVTNADLAKLKRKPAVSTLQPASIEDENIKDTSPPKKSPPRRTPAGRVRDAEKIEPQGVRSALEEKWKKAKEYADLLSLKMNALWQEFYSLDDMTSRDSIQREISETYLKFQKAIEDEAKARKELDQIKKIMRK